MVSWSTAVSVMMADTERWCLGRSKPPLPFPVVADTVINALWVWVRFESDYLLISLFIVCLTGVPAAMMIMITVIMIKTMTGLVVVVAAVVVVVVLVVCNYYDDDAYALNEVEKEAEEEEQEEGEVEL